MVTLSLSPSPSPRIQPSIQSMKPKQEIQQPKKRREKRSFWTAPGMNELVDWLTDFDNHKRLHAVRPVSGQRPVDVRKEISAYIKERCGAEMDEAQIKSKIQYAKKRYQEAKELTERTGEGDTESGTLRERMLELCPDYDRFHAIYAGNLALDPPAPIESTSNVEGHGFDESSESEGTDNGDQLADDGVVELLVRPEKITSRRSKRRRKQGSEEAERMLASINEIKSLKRTLIEGAGSVRDSHNDEDRTELRRREEALTKREESFQQSIALDKALLKSQWEALIREKEQFEARKAEWEKKHEELISENARMKAELQYLKPLSQGNEKHTPKNH
ncbi:hypothetical protein BGZ50_009828 [Haplosporangium sp. Z 11]|nr:hypothetical protein BGZ50_009828 [Haplosporangium sp. Z 11]